VSDDSTNDDGRGWLGEFRRTTEEDDLYRRAAQRSGLEIGHWARQTLNRAAQTILDVDEPSPATAGQQRESTLERLHAQEAVQRFLADATALLAESLDLRETLCRVVWLSIPVFADWCLLDLFTEKNHIERTEVAHADPAHVKLAEEVRHYGVDLERNPRYPATRVMMDGAPVLIESLGDGGARDLAHDDRHLGLIRATGVRSVICVALVAHGRTLGFLTFLTAGSGRSYGANDLVVAQDIARRCAMAIENARLFEETRRALRFRDDFLSVASHELRTPLTPLQLQVDALERRFSEFVKTGKESWLHERLGTMRRQTDRLQYLVDELLEMYQIDEGTIRLQREPLELAGVVRAVVSRFRDHHPDQKIIVDAAADLAGNWDRGRLEQVMANVLANAQRHGRGRPIHVRAWREEGAAAVAVTDERTDVVPRDHRRAVRGSDLESHARNYGGLGVGLFVTRQILDAMGGTVEVSAGQPGATFTVRVPFDPVGRAAARDPNGSAVSLH
jgi:signal transduction histidine kinase